MLPSSTVENYLKAIFQLQIGLRGAGELVPMGQLASTLGVAPGTATTMVKALSDSGLVQYEPYAGVRLSDSGEKLAALVLRRHRLIEQFLVQVMGMSWDEVHDEAEKLEHAVSERLIERMDEMLGRPQVDPHGDPIPLPDGSLEHRAFENLLTCPLNTPVAVARVADQDAAFLRFLETSNLKPGQEVQVEARDEAADSVRVRRSGDSPLTLGARAASKVLVDVLPALLLVLALAAPAGAQTQAAPPPPAEPFQIADNSFFVEEAFNQEAGIFQNIFGIERWRDGGWATGFTQEWPAPTIRHQLSYTVPVVGLDRETGVSDLGFTYRYQWFEEGPGRPAVSPRVTVFAPTGSRSRRLGEGSWGYQFNLPVSKQAGDVYFHGNAGFTHYPGAPTDELRADGTIGDGGDVSLFSPFVGGSAILRVKPMLNLMLESVVEWTEAADGPRRTSRQASTILAPGVRGGWNIGDRQVIVGAALPVSFTAGEKSDVGFFGYFSYELPFRR